MGVFELGNLDAPSALHLMKGTRRFDHRFRDEDMDVLRNIQEKVCGMRLGLALVGSILSEMAVCSSKLRETTSAAPRASGAGVH